MEAADLEIFITLASNLVGTIVRCRHPYHLINGNPPDLCSLLGLAKGMSENDFVKAQALEMVNQLRNAWAHPEIKETPPSYLIRGGFRVLIDWFKELREFFEIPIDNQIFVQVTVLALNSYFRREKIVKTTKPLVRVSNEVLQPPKTSYSHLPRYYPSPSLKKYPIQIITTPKEIQENEELRKRTFLVLDGYHTGRLLHIKRYNGFTIRTSNADGMEFTITPGTRIAFMGGT